VKILITDEISAEAVEILRANLLQVDVRTGLSRDDLESIVGEYDVLVVRGTTRVDAALIEKAERLRVIGRAGIGVDNIDLDAATDKGVVVMNSPRGNALAAAEHTIALVFALARKITLGDRSLKEGRWEKGLLTGVQISGKTLGIIGLGNVGRIVAGKAIALGMRVIAYDPYIAPGEARAEGVEMVDFDRLLGTSDFVTVHVPLGPGTRLLLDGRALSKLKEGAFVINAARGGIVDETALHDALKKGSVAGAGLDVFVTEPPKKDDRLVRSGKVVATPHVGGSTIEAQKKVAIDIASQVVDYLRDGIVTNGVNTPSVSREMRSEVEPYSPLAIRLARFVALANDYPIEEVEIEYRGAIAEAPVEVMTRQVLSRIFGGRAGGINPVNALVRMRSMGIKIREYKEVLSYYPTSLLIIRLKGRKGDTAAYGTLLKKNEARLIRLNNISVDADLTGRMLLVYCYDRPGLIGRVATSLAQTGVNIGEMHFGRERVGGLALSLFDVDQVVSDPAIDEIMSLPDIILAKRIDLSGD
jgi:D-3-phosphoglycerate dehydrogenase